MIMKNYLGEFEELVLLTVGVLGDAGYGVSIKEELQKRSGKKPSIGALHTALHRLELKEYIESWEGGATAKRGGRKKRFYKLSSSGQSALAIANRIRNEMFDLIPIVET